MNTRLTLRAILHCPDDVFRDIAIDNTATLEELHVAIAQAYDLEPGQMASFYTTDDQWTQLEEIPLIAMDPEGLGAMSDHPLARILGTPGQRLIFIYDFLALWTFMVEFVRQDAGTPGEPQIVLSYGDRPKEAPDPEFTGEGGLAYADEEDEEEDEYGFDEEDLDGYSSDAW